MKFVLLATYLLLINNAFALTEVITSRAVLAHVLERLGTEFNRFFNAQDLKASAEQGYYGERLFMADYAADPRDYDTDLLKQKVKFLTTGLTLAYNYGSAIRRAELVVQSTKK